jgi:hydroxypyruvate isomerase
MAEVFMARAKRNASTGVWEKGLEVRTSLDDAKQGFHAYMAAYAYGHDQTVDKVNCLVFDQDNMVRISEVWEKEQPEPNVEE